MRETVEREWEGAKEIERLQFPTSYNDGANMSPCNTTLSPLMSKITKGWIPGQTVIMLLPKWHECDIIKYRSLHLLENLHCWIFLALEILESVFFF